MEFKYLGIKSNLNYNSLVIYFLLFFIALGKCNAGSVSEFTIKVPKIVLSGIVTNIEVSALTASKTDTICLVVADETIKVVLIDGYGIFKHTFFDEASIMSQELNQSLKVHPIPLWLSILPPLLAIVVALLFREVISALFIGIFVGTSIIFTHQSFNIFSGILQGLLSIVDTYILESLADTGHLSIIIFSMLIGGMVGVISKNGGMKGVVNKLLKYANTPRSGQLITWLLGIAIFFDDYANTLVVGNTMRPVTDRLKISRQKLAYIVDSTAAPVAAIAFVTTWIGAELSYIQSGIETLGLAISPYNVFLNSLSYAFYPILTLIFMFMLIYKQVDFGPMFGEEIRARKSAPVYSNDKLNSVIGDDFNIDDAVPGRWYNAVIPVFIVVFGTFSGLIYTGIQATDSLLLTGSFFTKLSIVIGNSDSYISLLWSSLIATIVAVLLTVGQRILTIQESIEALTSGFKTMLTAIIILVLAWSLALVTQHLHTADFISQILMQTRLSPVFVPLITFILAALVAFSTGSSWGTMAILYPLILPASWLITKDFGYGHEQSLSIFYNVVSCVLAGSVLGDHCSPISDTTILSSLSSQCPHIEHVRTQMPYALTVGVVSGFLGVLPAALGVPGFITFPICILALILIIRLFGKSTKVY